nr:MAG TPA: hypothetical protein [Caudoviricetes sp.]
MVGKTSYKNIFKIGGVDINPKILQEMIRRDIDFDGWEDLV